MQNREDISRWFSAGFLFEITGSPRARVAEIALAFLGRGGKYLRPRLVHLVWSALAGGGDVRPLVIAAECFHKASLIHDDIEDDDDMRYGQPTVHKTVGIPLAVDAGDWLVATGSQLIARSGFPHADAMMQVLADSHRALCEGQGDELAFCSDWLHGRRARLSPEEALSVYSRKTGEAFALCAELGALAANADHATCAAVRAFGLAYGIAFQIHDDLDDGGHLLLDACGGDTHVLQAHFDTAREACARAAASVSSPALATALVSYLKDPLQ